MISLTFDAGALGLGSLDDRFAPFLDLVLSVYPPFVFGLIYEVLWDVPESCK
jgi:hypothetical protein